MHICTTLTRRQIAVRVASMTILVHTDATIFNDVRFAKWREPNSCKYRHQDLGSLTYMFATQPPICGFSMYFLTVIHRAQTYLQDNNNFRKSSIHPDCFQRCEVVQHSSILCQVELNPGEQSKDLLQETAHRQQREDPFSEISR